MINKLKKSLFRTRYELKNDIKSLQNEIILLSNSLKAHFDIKYTLDDFSKWADQHPDAKMIFVTEGEYLHYMEVISKPGHKVTLSDLDPDASFRGLLIRENPSVITAPAAHITDSKL